MAAVVSVGNGAVVAVLVAVLLDVALLFFVPEVMDWEPGAERFSAVGAAVWIAAVAVGLLSAARVWRRRRPR